GRPRGGLPRRLAERRADGLQRGVGNRVNDRLDLEQRLADGQPGRQLEEGRLAGGDGRVIGEDADGVALAEVIDAQPAVGLLLDADVVARDVPVLEDAARDAVALGAAAELDGAG